MVIPKGIRSFLLHVGVHGIIGAAAASAAAQSTAAFPDVPTEQPPPQAAPAPAPAPVPTAPPVAPPPAVSSPYSPPTQPQYAPYPAEVQPAYTEPAHPEARPGGFAPPVLPYREDAAIPDGYRLEQKPVYGLMTAGALVLGASYAIAVGVAAAHGFDRANGWLAVPVIGPWVALTKRESPCDIEDVSVRDDAEDCVNSALDEAALIAAIAVDGLAQATGTALFLGGAFSKHEELVREDVASWRVTPQRVGQYGYGLGLQGRF